MIAKFTRAYVRHYSDNNATVAYIARRNEP